MRRRRPLPTVAVVTAALAVYLARGGRLFPGLLLEAFVAGGTPDVSATRAFSTVAVYVVAAAIVGGIIVARRDVTA